MAMGHIEAQPFLKVAKVEVPQPDGGRFEEEIFIQLVLGAFIT